MMNENDKMKHPDEETMNRYVEGSIDPQLAVLIKAHIHECAECREAQRTAEARQAQRAFAANTVSMAGTARADSSAVVAGEAPDFSGMFDAIVCQPGATQVQGGKSGERDESAGAVQASAKVLELPINNLKVELPASIARLAQHTGKWRSIGRKIASSRVNVAGSGNLYFIYFAEGASIASHAHTGEEYCYVVAGNFHDQHAEYITGDFGHFKQNDAHAPSTSDPDGCLLLVKLDGTFDFKEGLARVLNWFNWLKFLD